MAKARNINFDSICALASYLEEIGMEVLRNLGWKVITQDAEFTIAWGQVYMNGQPINVQETDEEIRFIKLKVA